jgi:hypothetical protein
MEHLVCSSVKELMVDYLRSMTDASQVDDDCVVTLPITTFDQRWVEVSIKQRSPGQYIVDDGGKAWDELFVQGVPLTENTSSKFTAIASKFGVDFEKGRFRVGCNLELLQHSIWTIGQCSALAASELIDHKPSAEKDLKKAVGGIVTDWSGSVGFSLQFDRTARGRYADHKFDFVATDLANTIAINVLAPSSGGLGRAERYGYQALDLENTPEGSWKKVAVLSRPEYWSYDARMLVKKFATRVVDYQNPQNAREPIFTCLNELTNVA